MSRKLIEEYGRWGVEVNTDKTQYICRGHEESPGNLDLEKQKIKNCSECVYLGVKRTTTGKCDDTVKIEKLKEKGNSSIELDIIAEKY